MRWWLLVGVVIAVAVACGGEDDEGVAHIAMLDNVYGRDLTRIDVGGTVEFTNDGRAPHNAVAADGSWSTEEAFGALAMENGDSVRLTYDTAGTYEYFCTFHSTDGEGMVATLVVGDMDQAYAPVDGEPPAPPPEEWTGTTRHVPADYPTISDAVDAADPGDLVLIEPGIYPEQVDVTTPGLVIRGTDRNEVIIDGGFERANGINVIGADGVAVENLTVRNTTGNGVFWSSVEGYRASYVTSIHADVYGIYAFDSIDGLFEHSYASGSWDSGFYIGQCDPCRAVITDVVSEWNGLGYSGTNASGDLWLVDSVWRNNIAGIVPNTLDSELLPPVERLTIAGNLVHDHGCRRGPRPQRRLVGLRQRHPDRRWQRDHGHQEPGGEQRHQRHRHLPPTRRELLAELGQRGVDQCHRAVRGGRHRPRRAGRVGQLLHRQHLRRGRRGDRPGRAGDVPELRRPPAPQPVGARVDHREPGPARRRQHGRAPRRRPRRGSRDRSPTADAGWRRRPRASGRRRLRGGHARSRRHLRP